MINTDFHNILGPYSVETLSNMINAKMYNVDNQRLISGAADVENAKHRMKMKHLCFMT